jgi:hypothetical protein
MTAEEIEARIYRDRPRNDNRFKSNCHEEPQASSVLKSAPASSFRMTAIDWLWPERFALGKLGLLVGLPDEGKGQIFADIAARVTRILEWPCGEGVAPQGNVILLSAEDAPNDTVVPRLAAAGADLDRIEIVSMVVNTDAKERMFSLATDLVLLRRKIAEVGNVKLVLLSDTESGFSLNDMRPLLFTLAAQIIANNCENKETYSLLELP